MEIKDLIKIGREYLVNSEYTNSKYECENLLSKLLKVDRSYILAYPEKLVEENAVNKYFNILERRKKGEPLQYILGETEFMGLRILTEKNVLIPRADTEISVEFILKVLENRTSAKILEIGVGSGAVSISLAKFGKMYSVFGVDISESALQLANRNKKLHNVENLEFFHSNLFSNVTGKYDIIYSNPPYIPSLEIETLQSEVKDYEPRLALDGGEKGLDFYEKIVAKAGDFLNKSGYLVFEIGYNQGDEVEKLLRNQGFTNIRIIKDLAKKDRVIVGKKS